MTARFFHDPVNDDRWMDQGNCVGLDTNVFFPERGAPTIDAKEVCAGCPVQGECLEYALALGIKWGVWGGTSEYERREIRRRRNAAARAAKKRSGGAA